MLRFPNNYKPGYYVINTVTKSKDRHLELGMIFYLFSGSLFYWDMLEKKLLSHCCSKVVSLYDNS